MNNVFKNKILALKKLTAESRKQKASSGFTIIELVTVIGIFGIMASILLFNFQTFTVGVDMNNLAQDVALHIVEAQKAAISGVQNAYTLNFNTVPSYGVYFTNNTSGGQNKQFIYFSDNNLDKIFEPQPNPNDFTTIDCSSSSLANECISVTSITTGEYVSNICYKSSSVSDCLGGSGQIFATFTRPFPDATFCAREGTTSPCLQGVSEVQIELTSGTNASLMKTIVITSLGQIRVQDGGNTIA